MECKVFPRVVLFDIFSAEESVHERYRTVYRVGYAAHCVRRARVHIHRTVRAVLVIAVFIYDIVFEILTEFIEYGRAYLI